MSEEVVEVDQPDVDMTNISNWIISAGVNHGYQLYRTESAVTSYDPSNLMYEKMLAGSSPRLMVSVRGWTLAIRISIT